MDVSVLYIPHERDVSRKKVVEREVKFDIQVSRRGKASDGSLSDSFV